MMGEELAGLCRSRGAGRFLEVTHLPSLGGSRREVAHWAARKTLSQVLLLFLAQISPP